MTHFLLTVLSHTPLWVWAILATLVALGVKQSREHVVGRSKLLLQPLGVGVLSLVSVASVFGLVPLTVVGWLLGAAAGAAISRLLGLPRRLRALPDGRFAIGGSWVPMALLMGIFWLRYAVAASLAVVPALAAMAAFAAAASALYGLTCGLFGARAWRVLQAAPAGQPADQPAPLRAASQ